MRKSVAYLPAHAWTHEPKRIRCALRPAAANWLWNSAEPESVNFVFEKSLLNLFSCAVCVCLCVCEYLGCAGSRINCLISYGQTLWNMAAMLALFQLSSASPASSLVSELVIIALLNGACFLNSVSITVNATACANGQACSWGWACIELRDFRPGH